MAGELELKTVLDPSGVTRTHAVLPRLYARKELLSVKLPADARLVALCVDDQNVRPVQGAEPGIIRVPLPPRSNSRVELAYECRHPALGWFGTWEETAPELLRYSRGRDELASLLSAAVLRVFAGRQRGPGNARAARNSLP